MRQIVLFFPLVFALSVAIHARSVQMQIEHSFLLAKDKAELEHKPYIVQFTAKWSTPCKWMDQTTFKEEALIKRINDEVIFVRVNIEQFEGYTLKKYFEIHSLPSFLFFTPDHRLMHSVEGSLTTTQFTGLLDDFRNGKFSEQGNPMAGAGMMNRPITKESRRASVPAEKPSAEPENNLSDEEEIARTSFRIQVGAFSNIDNARDKEGELRRMVEQEFRIESASTANGSPIHRLYLGNFPTRSTALEFLHSWKAMGMDGMLKEVSLSEKI